MSSTYLCVHLLVQPIYTSSIISGFCFSFLSFYLGSKTSDGRILLTPKNRENTQHVRIIPIDAKETGLSTRGQFWAKLIPGLTQDRWEYFLNPMGGFTWNKILLRIRECTYLPICAKNPVFLTWMHEVKTDSNDNHSIIHGSWCSLAWKSIAVYFGTFWTNLDFKD